MEIKIYTLIYFGNILPKHLKRESTTVIIYFFSEFFILSIELNWTGRFNLKNKDV